VQVASFVGVQTVDVATLPVPVHDVQDEQSASALSPV
jgi:hypothetical protein